MKAVVLKNNFIKIENIDQPQRQKNESLIKVHLAGICNTDLELMKGYMGYQGVLGHEFVGTVVESDQKNLLNKRVVGEINLACGSCTYCLSGMERHCPNRTVLGIDRKDGAMSEYLTLPDKNLWCVPDNVTNEQAVFTEPLAAAFEILEQVHVQPDAKVLLLGDGKLGQLIARVMYAAGADITVVGKNLHKLQLLQAKGIHTISVKDFKISEFPFVIEATGSVDGFETAVQCTKPRGTLVLKSTIAAKSGLNLAMVVVKELNIVGSRCGPFGAALKAMQNKSIQTDDLITDRYLFSEALPAFKQAQKSESLKIILKISDE